MDKLAYLKTVHLFDGLSDAEMRECEAAFPMVTPEKGRTLFTPTSTDEALYIIKDGSVRLYRVSPDGREVTLGLLKNGDVFGTLPMFGAVGRNSFAAAETDSVLCIMREGHLGSLIARHPEIVGSLERRDIVRTGYRSIAVIDKPSLETRAAD